MAIRVTISEGTLTGEDGTAIDITSLYAGRAGPTLQNPSGGGTEDAECRAVLVALLDFLRDRGDLAPP